MAAIGALLVGCAPVSPSAGQAADAEPPAPPRAARCLRLDQIDNWRVIDSRNLIVYGPRRSQAWHLRLFASCTDLGFAETLAFRTRGGDLLCGDPGDELLLRNSRCAIVSMRPIGAAEEAELTNPRVRTDIGRLPPAESAPDGADNEDTD